jgi:ferritin-like metal-binding protein YciE
MAAARTLKELFLDELEDRCDAETRVAQALPRIETVITMPKFKELIHKYKKEVNKRSGPLVSIYKSFEKDPEGRKSQVAIGMIVESNAIIANNKGSDDLLNKSLINFFQKMKGYDLASYITLHEWAEKLEHTQAVKVLKEIIEEEKEFITEINEMSDLEKKHAYPVAPDPYSCIKQAAAILERRKTPAKKV